MVGISSLAYWDWRGGADPLARRQLDARIGSRSGRAALRAWGVRLPEQWDEPESPEEVVGKIAPTPVAIIHGNDDHLFAPDHARRLYEAAGEPKRLLLGDRFGHAEDGLTPAFERRLGAHRLRDAGAAVVRVRLFAALREAADASEAEVAGKTVGDVVDALSIRFGERFAAVAAVSSFVVNGERAARSTPIAEGDEVALLPPVSGGAPLAEPPVRQAQSAIRASSAESRHEEGRVARLGGYLFRARQWIAETASRP